MIVTPMPWRDYKSAKDARADWDANKDFIIQDMSSPWDGKPVNKEQVSGRVEIRFAKLRKLTMVQGGKS